MKQLTGCVSMRRLVLIVSMVLCAGAIALWVASWTISTEAFHEAEMTGFVLFQTGSGESRWGFVASEGKLSITRWRVAQGRDEFEEKHWEALGFVMQRFYLEMQGTAPSWQWMIDIPFWALTIASGAYPLYIVRGSIRRRTRRRRGLCESCGYFLTGLTEPRCPECGHGFTYHEQKDH